MKDFFHSRGFKVLITVVFIMFGLMLYTASTGSSLTANLLSLISTPMQRVSTVVTNNAAVAAQNATRTNEELAAENTALKKQIEELNKKLINYYSYQQENAQLRKFLELKNENKDFKPVSAAVIGRDPNDLFYNFQIDKGSLAGISVNDPVITEGGVVGWISSVNASYSRVTTILSADTKISAIDKVNRDSGVISSDIKFADKGVLKLGYLTADTTVKPGDIIVTSGLGGVFPRNLAIGTVNEVKNDPYDVSLYAEIKPFVDVKTVRDVMVITAFEGQGQALSDGSSSASSTASSTASSSSSSTVSSGGK
ncbi:MAG: rod shape-determining protein MreC [Ruminococcaceae bacterium]|nr:rod shape-determining protein MreC [Oscillospiraceae bacterium]